MVLRAAVVLLALAIAPARAANPQMEAMAGKWYGAIADQGLRYEWLAEDRVDGTVHIQFQDCQTGAVTVETGTWYATEDLYVTLTTIEGDLGLGTITNSYLVEDRTDNVFRYRHLGTGILFEARRMEAEFQLPGCDVSS